MRPNSQVQRVWIGVFFAANIAGGETFAHVLLILEAQKYHTALEQQEVEREWDGPGACHG